jgi:hypothetical protein
MARVARGDDRAKTGRRGAARAWNARLRSAFFAWIAVLALIVQLGSTPGHRAIADSGQAEAVAALGALEALLGPNVALCLHEDGSAPGSPSHDSHPCCDDCALCHSGGHLAALLPRDHDVPAIFANYSKSLSVPAEAGLAKPQSFAFAQPRAPPISA